MPNVRGGRGEGFGGAATAGRNSESSSRAARAGDSRGSGSGGGSTGGGFSAGNQYAGYRGPIGTSNPNTSVAPGGYGLSSDEKRQYEAAKTEYQNRSFGKRVVDFLSPIHSVNPQINQPSSWMGGEYHHGISPGGIAAGLLGGVLPGAGLLTGPLGSAAWTGAGLHDVVLTGPGYAGSTSYPGGGPGYNSSTGYAGPGGAPSSPEGKDSQSGIAHLQNLATLNQNISGNPGAPEAISAPTGPATPTGPNWAQMMASMRQVTPGYSVQLPGYNYTKATV